MGCGSSKSIKSLSTNPTGSVRKSFVNAPAKSQLLNNSSQHNSMEGECCDDLTKLSDATTEAINDEKGKLEIPTTFDEGMREIPGHVAAISANPDWLMEPHGLRTLKYIQKVYFLAAGKVFKQKYAELILDSGMVEAFVLLSSKILPENYLGEPKMVNRWKIACGIMWNATDASEKICQACDEKGVVAILLPEFEKEQFSPSNLKQRSIELYLTKAYLGILHNMLRMVPTVRDSHRSANGVSILQNVMTSTFYIIKIKCLINLGYIVDENETDRLVASEDSFQFLMKMLDSAVSNEDHKATQYLFSAEELVDGMNRIAANEKAKELFIEQGAVKLYLMLLNDPVSDDLERRRAANGLWTLSFVGRKDLKTQMRNEPGLEDSLRKIIDNADENEVSQDLAKKAYGTLWELLGDGFAQTQARKNRMNSASSKKSSANSAKGKSSVDNRPHVMISYNHRSAQTQMLWLNQQLKSNGFKVWIDVEQMHGDTLEAMAEAVENAAVVLVSVTQRYKESPACRKEASYADVRGIPIVPLLVEDKYRADGWLGLLIANKLWFNLSTEERREQQLPRLISELSQILDGKRIHTPLQQQQISHSDFVEPVGASRVESTPQPPPRPSTASSTVSKWTEMDVAKWCERNEFSKDKLKGFNGTLLLELQTLYQAAPDFTCQRVEKQFDFDLLTLLKFLRALRHL